MSHPGTYVNAPTLGVTGLVPGDPDTAVAFDPASDQYVVQDDTVPQQTFSAFTIGAIIKPNNANDPNAPNFWGFVGSAGINLTLGQTGVSSKLGFIFSPGDGFSGFASFNGATTIADGSTYRVIATWDGTTAKLYVDGALDGSMSFSIADIIAGGGSAWVLDEDLNFYAATDQFNTTGNFSLDGTLDELFFVANHAATVPEIAAIDAAMTGTGDVVTEINALSPFIYWRLGEASGTAAADSASTPPAPPDLTSQRPTLSLFSDFTAPSNLTPYGTEPAFSIMRGTSSPGLTGFVADAGTFQTSLDNSDRRFDPNNLSGPYVVDGVSEVVPGREVAALATWNGVVYPLFFGYADGWPQTYPMDGADLIVDLHATDAFAMLANAQLTLRRRHEYTGARIQAILNDIGYAGSTDIAHGNSIVGPLRFTTVSALSHLADVGQAEWGEFYVDASGVLFFRDRDTILTDTRSSVSQASFVQSPPGLQFNNPVMTEFKPINEVVIVYSDTGKQVTVRDEASIAMPWSRGTPNTLNLSLPFSTSSQARAYARWILDRYKNPVTTFASITLIPANHPGETDDLWVQALSRELGDLITVTLDPLNDANPIVRDCVIRGIQYDFQTFPWSTTFYLQDASWLAGLFRLDASELDGPDVLGM